MLVQSFRREVPGHDAFFHRTMLRHERFSITILRSRGIANDYGMLQHAVTYLLRFTRSQLVILLAGRGYFRAENGQCVSLVAGNVIESDQLRREEEGYSGSPCELLIIEWDAGGLFGHDTRGDARISRISPADVARLRAHVARFGAVPTERWVAELCARVAALGLPLESADALRTLDTVPASLVQTYGAIGDTLARLDAQPNLAEVAEALGLCERQANRRLAELEHTYGHPFDGWRDFVHESRIEWALQLLSLPDVPLAHAARLAGYRSAVALCHAFALRGVGSPGVLARQLAEHWR